MASIFLCRESRLFTKYTDCTAVSMTGQVTAYGSITGVAATDIITIPGLTAVNGLGVTFTNLAGGAGLTTGVKYYLIGSSGSTAQLSTTQGGSAIDFTTNITSATTVLIQSDELMVWSSEFRDIFTPSSTLIYSSAGATSGAVPAQTAVIYAGPITVTAPVGGVTTTGVNIVPTSSPYASNSDEIFHNPLRQTFLARTHWKFTMATGPTPLYATWADGDIIANSPPNTP